MQHTHRGILSVVILFLLVVSACGPAAPTAPAEPQATVEPQPTKVPDTPAPTRTPQPSATPKPTLTPPPTKTPTPEPTPRPTEPEVLATISGTGSLVTDNYDLPQCNKAVFVWTAQASGRGTASLILKLYNVAAGGEKTVVNEFETDLEGNLSGMELQPLKGGEYYFSSENTDLGWEVRVECHDGLAPVMSGSMVVTGTGNTVSANYELPACNKSIFSWEAAANERGTASIIAYLCKDGVLDCVNLANEFQMDLTGPLTGQAVQKLSGGMYYLYVYNLSGPTWAVTWECKD